MEGVQGVEEEDAPKLEAAGAEDVSAPARLSFRTCAAAGEDEVPDDDDEGEVPDDDEEDEDLVLNRQRLRTPELMCSLVL